MADDVVQVSRPEPMGLFRGICVAAGIWSIGAGVIHFLAVDAHRGHAVLAGLLVATGVAQVGWGIWVMLRPSRLLLLAGVAGQLAVFWVWALSRTIGVPFLPGAEEPSPVRFPDIAATLFEVLAAGSAGLAAGFSAATAAIAVPAGRQFVGGATMAVLVLLAPATLAEGRVHRHDSATSAHGHADGQSHDDAHGVHGKGRHQHEGADGQRGSGHEHDARLASGGHAHDAGGHADGSRGAGGHEHGSGGHDHGSGGHDHGSSHGGSSHESFPQPELWGQKTTMRIGPFPLGAGERTGQLHVNRPGPVPQKPCTDCYITGFVPKLVYEDGTTADVDTGPMLHHVVVMDTGRGDPTCDRWNGIGLFGQRIFASGNERTVFAYPRGFGYRPSNAPWGFVTELMNSSDEIKTVYVEIDIYNVPASTPGMKRITPVWLDVVNCTSSKYTAPAGRSVRSWSWQSSITGRIVTAGGHVHGGGVGMILRNASTGRRLCTSEASYGVAGPFRTEVDDMSTCVWDRVGTVREGQRLDIDTVYDVQEPADDVMGIMVLGIHETNDLSGGTPAPAWMTRNLDTQPPGGGHHH